MLLALIELVAYQNLNQAISLSRHCRQVCIFLNIITETLLILTVSFNRDGTEAVPCDGNYLVVWLL